MSIIVPHPGGPLDAPQPIPKTGAILSNQFVCSDNPYAVDIVYCKQYSTDMRYVVVTYGNPSF
eukprot:12733066-Ditylum_brightwellii.AAC.1